MPMVSATAKCSWPPPQMPLTSLTVRAENLNTPSSYALLLHGLTGTPLEMLPLANALAARGIESFIPLLPGHGTSLHDLSATKPGAWVSCVEQALNALVLKSESKEIFLCGLSFGALLALLLMRSHPLSISRAVLLSPPISLRSKKSELFLALLRKVPDSLLAWLGTKAKTARAQNYLQEQHFAYLRHSLAATVRLTQLRSTILHPPPPWEKPLMLGIDPLDHLIDSTETTRWFQRTYPRGHTCELLKGEHELTLGHRRQELFKEIENFFK